MKIEILETAAALSDADLLLRLSALAGKEREASAELVAHLAELDTRPGAYAAQGFGSLFGYCTQALRLSEDAACNRIEAARACRRFPIILDLLASGVLSLTAVRILRRHLTEENHETVLAQAKGQSRHVIDAIVAELSPQPDAGPSVRKLPTTPINRALMPLSSPLPTLTEPVAPVVPFTIGQETHEKLRRLQALLRREIPDGDPGTIFDHDLSLLLEKEQKTKLAAAVSPRPAGAIRPGTDKVHKSAFQTRHIPREVRRAVWQRDGGLCAFVSAGGRRCRESTFLELHHVKPYAKEGPATVANISLRCRRHNQYEAELMFGPHERRSHMSDRRPQAAPVQVGSSREGRTSARIPSEAEHGEHHERHG